MKEMDPSNVIKGKRPGDVAVIRRTRRPKRRLRPVPNIPAFVRFLGDLVTETPLIPIILALTVLLLVFSTVLYAIEHDTNPSLDSFGEAVWWCIAAMQTMGGEGPITDVGRALGSIWAILSTILFFGAIIAGMTSYFMLHRRRPSKEIVSTIQYNLERLEDLSVSELEVLKVTINTVIESRIKSLQTEG